MTHAISDSRLWRFIFEGYSRRDNMEMSGKRAQLLGRDKRLIQIP
jgi:hypothetical protein